MVGPLTLDVHQLTVDTRPDQLLVAYTAPPDSPSQEALRFLLQWSGHPLGGGHAPTADRPGSSRDEAV
ncbi:MAG: hypothetical protein QOC85_3416 [Streptomyces sp.]|nr:hypothetical protein [Streptomyces sp.]